MSKDVSCGVLVYPHPPSTLCQVPWAQEVWLPTGDAEGKPRLQGMCDGITHIMPFCAGLIPHFSGV